MSIQGSVNQLFTIGGSFAGMYGLLHPEIKEGRALMKETKAGMKDVSENLSKIPNNVSEMSKEELNVLEDKLDITSERAEKIISDVHKNPSLLKNKEIKAQYDGLVKISKEEREFKNVRKGIANRRDVLNQPTLDEVVADLQAKGVKISWGYPADKAQSKLQSDGMQKVNQRDTYAQRRKDKGDI